METDKLSSEAIELLTEATKDSNGIIMYSVTFDGPSLGTNGKSFITERRNPQIKALWESVLEELENSRCINRFKGESYSVTHIGYERVKKITNQK